MTVDELIELEHARYVLDHITAIDPAVGEYLRMQCLGIHKDPPGSLDHHNIGSRVYRQTGELEEPLQRRLEKITKATQARARKG